jgi:hypothetical protein
MNDSSYDERYGTDYEGKIGLGGKFFHPLRDFAPLPDRLQELLLRFQSAIPEDAYGFLYIPSHIIQVMLENERGLVLGRHTQGEAAPITILVVLGDKIYGMQKYDLDEVGNVKRLETLNRRFERTEEVVARILDTGKKILGEQEDFSFELSVVHRNQVDALLTPFFIMKAMGDSGAELEGAESQFYRLR